MKAVRKMTQIEIAAYVQSHLLTKNIDVILSGGSLVSFYSNGKYVSRDIDLVNRFSTARPLIRDAMQDIDFYEEGRYFRHPDTEHIIEFPPGPLSIGSEPVRDIVEMETETGILRVLSATDCVKDRLSAYYFWKDNQSLEQAIMIASQHMIDIEEIRRWSYREGKGIEYQKIVSILHREK